MLSKSQQVNEYLKCKNSFEYYCRNYVYLEIPGQDILFQPYKKQIELIDFINKEKYCIILKSRQIGISTVTQAYCSWLANFYENTVIGIISKDAPEATVFARTIRGMIEKLPPWMKPPKGSSGPGFAKFTEQSFILTNGSKVFASTVNPNAPEKTLRGKAITFLVIDEGAFIQKIDEAWVGLVPALSTQHKACRLNKVPYGLLILSTPNRTLGTGAWFYNKYTRAVSRVSDEIIGSVKPFVIHWKHIEELANDPLWYKTQCELFDNDPKKIEQELEMKFLPAGGSFFSDEICLKLQNNTIDPIETMKLFNGEIWVWEKPIEGRYYITGVDTASEYGTDNSAITIYDYETLNQVWEYQGKLPVRDFEKVVKFACSQYNGTVVVENNSYGNQTTESLDNSEYMHMLYREKRSENITKPGLTTNVKTRPLMIDSLYDYITKFPEIVKSKRLALELIGLVQKPSGKVEGDKECRDDLALTASMCFYCRKYDPPLMIDSSKYHESMFEDIMDMNDQQYRKKGVDLDSIIMKQVKSQIHDPTKSFVDTLQYYNKG
jgi:hypothetical protein